MRMSDLLANTAAGVCFCFSGCGKLRISVYYSKRGKQLRFELAQTSNYSPSENIVNEMIYFVYDK